MKSAIKYHGGKYYLAKSIVSLFPPKQSKTNRNGYVHYVETHFGSGAVLFENDPDGISEVANDIYQELMIFWEVLRTPALFEHFLQALSVTPFSESIWKLSLNPGNFESCFLRCPQPQSLARAMSFFVRCRQSLAGRMASFAPRSRSRTRQGMNEQVAAWLSSIDGLPPIHKRIQRVLMLDQSATDCIKSEDSKSTLFYEDPPYLADTRTTGGEYGLNEYSYADHVDLLCLQSKEPGIVDWERYEKEGQRKKETAVKLLNHEFQGRFVLSGYDSPLYESFRKTNKWRKQVFSVPNNAAAGTTKRIMDECCWMNY